MVQNFIEQESTEKQPSAAAKFGRNRCNCFNGNSNDSSDDEFDVFAGFGGESITSRSSFGGDFSGILKVKCRIKLLRAQNSNFELRLVSQQPNGG